MLCAEYEIIINEYHKSRIELQNLVIICCELSNVKVASRELDLSLVISLTYENDETWAKYVHV